MFVLNSKALLVHKALLRKGLESPLRNINKSINNITRKKIISKYIEKIMLLLNLDVKNDSLSKTPDRIVKMYFDDIFFGLDYINFPEITLIDNTMNVDETVTIHHIGLTSTCEHHFVVIDGNATVAYIPKNKIIGLSKINRIVQFFSSRPQIQERLNQQIFIALKTILETNNVAVSINAVHYCVKARGIRDRNSSITTMSLGGVFKTRKDNRKEFFYSLQKKY